MVHRRPVLAIAATLLLAAGGALAGLPGGEAHAATSLCQSQTASVAGGSYIVQNNEWNSSAQECVTTDGNADFTVASSAINNATNGAPGTYPSIYQGCHWGLCSSGGLSSQPVEVSNLTSGAVTSSWSTTQPGSGAYDVAYDIWFNQAPTTTGQPNGTEIMVWLNHAGGVQPFGSVVASNVSIGGHTYNVWYGTQSTWDTVSYVMTSGATSVSNLDIGTLAQDSVSRGYTKSSWYLIDVEAGFELWQGGAGLATNSFSVTENGGSSTPPPPPPPPPSSGCSAAYSVTGSWSGGYQAQVVVTNTGSGTKNGWHLGWTFPGGQSITNLWNGSYTQSGSQVTVTNASYDGSLAPGATATVGFTANGSATPAPAVSCS
ncbi:MAG TPA: cellulose binding domain-containing protein [Trebonia sp.]|jgi:cellulose 1,4-beta-cellobiosidase|nr:cellulose binding domain-containing protein [Trebonia sp.]